MHDFWQGNFEKETSPHTKKFVNIDSIKLVKKQIEPVRPSINKPKKYKFYLGLMLTIIFLSCFVVSGLYVAQASRDKLNILKTFRSGRYLVLFQNNSELRPTGGFIGSFAIVTFSNYKIKNIDFNTNIYKLDQAFTAEHTIIPPAPLYAICNGKWTLRDSNFAVSFPEAAKQVEWFYNQETGDSVDGVIAVNASVVRDLLDMTGPITLANYNTEISSANFFTELTTQIEKNYFTKSENRDENEPKTILRDLLPQLMQKLIREKKVELVKKINTEIKEKQILFYSNDSQIENSILAENWGGEIQSTNSDYLHVNNANIGGAKSSLSVSEKLDYKVKNADKGLRSDLTITRSHAGTNVWPDAINHNYIRVLVPNGAKIISSTLNGKDNINKITIGEEAGKTYFAVHLETAPGTSDVVNLIYQLPENISARNYGLLVQKQSGNLGDNLSVKFENELLFDGILNTDKEIKK